MTTVTYDAATRTAVIWIHPGGRVDPDEALRFVVTAYPPVRTMIVAGQGIWCLHGLAFVHEPAARPMRHAA